MLKNIRNNWIAEATQELRYYTDGEKTNCSMDWPWTFTQTWVSQNCKTFKADWCRYFLKACWKTENIYLSPCISWRNSTCPKPNSKLTNISEGYILLIEKFVDFWKIVNARSLFDNTCLWDTKLDAVNFSDHENLAKFIEMCNFNKKFPNKTSKRVKCLTKITRNSLTQFVMDLWNCWLICELPAISM